MSEEPGQPITGLRRGAVGENVFLCGDPARVPRIAKGWSNTREILNLREYRIAVGERDGVRLAAASTGIGAPSTAILVEELAKIGAKRLIRVGNSGGLQPALGLGDLVITTGAVRDDGTSKSYVLPEYPAVASFRVVGALVAAAQARGVRHAVGVTWSRDARVQNCEMESGILLTLASLFGLEAGCICVVSDRAPWPGPAELDIDKNMDACIAVATAAMQRL